jgi:HPt (histidine-containing phosphotransfer) domain-containing protein
MNFLKDTDQAVENLYDLSMIEKLCRGNQVQILKMVEVFTVQLSESVEEIKSAFKKRDLVRINSIIHKIKPTLAYYGTEKIAREILMIEALIEDDFESIELQLKIRRFNGLTTRVVDHIKKDFNITINKNYE